MTLHATSVALAATKRCQKLSFFSFRKSLVLLVHFFVAAAVVALACYTPSALGDPAGAPVTQSESKDCSTRLAQFIEELDSILRGEPSSIQPLRYLLDRTFPQRNCDPEVATAVSRRSAYFRGVESQPEAYVFTFGTPGGANRATLSVGFGILKASGETWLPFAQFNK
jgi:hypothetical protein